MSRKIKKRIIVFNISKKDFDNKLVKVWSENCKEILNSIQKKDFFKVYKNYLPNDTLNLDINLYTLSESFIKKFPKKTIKIGDYRSYIEKIRENNFKQKAIIQVFIDMISKVEKILVIEKKDPINEKIISVTDLVIIGDSRVLRI